MEETEVRQKLREFISRDLIRDESYDLLDDEGVITGDQIRRSGHRNLAEVLPSVIGWQRSDRAAIHPLEHDEGPLRPVAIVEHAQHVRMVESSHEPGFGREHLERERLQRAQRRFVKIAVDVRERDRLVATVEHHRQRIRE